MHLIRRQTCRVCGSSALKKVIDLGDQHLQGSFVKADKELPPLRKLPTAVVRCDPMKDEKACGLLQMQHTVPPEVLYSAYWYRSGTNNTMRNHLKGIADRASGMVTVKKPLVLDIGCNDGTLLKSYPSNFEKFGVDPSDVAKEVSGDIKVVQDLFPSHELTSIINGRKFDIITSIAMFYDLEDPTNFVREIKKALSDEGIWIFEMSYMPTMLQMNAYDTICHEHLEYYSLAAIEFILRATDMKLVDVELNNINGGSVRCFVTHSSNFKFKNPEFQERIRALRQQEFDLELDTDKPYQNFQDRINIHKDELTALLRKIKREGKKIHLYGASTKGNTILQWCAIDSRMIDYAAERNPDKYGASTLGTDIPIISEEESRKLKPDYYLVLPWHFKEEFLQREAETIKAGTKMIFPLPTVEVIDANSLQRHLS
jgi:SAM-dependent methyltransferase